MPSFEVETGTGSATATSYCSVATADDWHTMSPSESTWSALTTEQKQERLMLGSYLLDQRCTWLGSKSVTASRLRWPRAGLLDRDGNAIDIDEIPRELAWATAEMARQMGSASIAGGTDRTVTSQTTGPVSVTYGDAGRLRRDIPQSVLELVYPFLETGSRIARA